MNRQTLLDAAKVLHAESTGNNLDAVHRLCGALSKSEWLETEKPRVTALWMMLADFQIHELTRHGYSRVEITEILGGLLNELISRSPQPENKPTEKIQ